MSSFATNFQALVGTPFLGENDCLLVALAGHGVQFDSKDVKDKSAFFFCPADADIRNLKHAEDVREGNNLLSMDELYSTLKKSKAGVKLLMVDACRIDPSRPAAFRAPSSITLPKIPPPPGGMAAFFSCSARQKASRIRSLSTAYSSTTSLRAWSAPRAGQSWRAQPCRSSPRRPSDE